MATERRLMINVIPQSANLSQDWDVRQMGHAGHDSECVKLFLDSESLGTRDGCVQESATSIRYDQKIIQKP